MERKKSKTAEVGVTLISLVTTIIVLLILAGITVYSGKETIKKAKLEELRTNMLLIQAKAREYVEEANFKMGSSPDNTKRETVKVEVYETEAKLKKAEQGIVAPSSIPLSECYQLTQEALTQWGLNKIELKSDECYWIQFDENNATVEIYYNKGYNDNGVMKYSLTEIDKIS